MKRTRNWFTRVLALCLALALLCAASACGADETQESGAAGSVTSGQDVASTGETDADSGGATEEPVELVISFWSSIEPADLDEVFAKLSEYTEEKIGVTVKPFTVNMANYPQQTNLMLSGGEQIDLMCMYYEWFQSMYSKGHLKQLDDLVESDGQGIVEAIGWDFLDAGRIGGGLYGLTTNRDLAKEYGFLFDKEMAERNGIDLAAIETFDDVEAAFAIIKENEPGVTPVVGTEASYAAEYLIPGLDLLGDGLGALLDYGEDLTVVNYYDSEDYMEMAQRMRRWYENGYISEDVVTSGEDARAYFKAGTAFAALATLKPGYAFKESKTIGKEMEQVGIIAPTTNTTVVQSIQWTIPENCEYPEKAMQMLNLMYSDETVMNLLAWGIEGEHYEVLDSGLIDYPEGVTGETSGYNLNYGWMFGNQFITYVWNGDSPTIWEETDEFNKSAKKSAAFGFSYDSANVKTELAACSNVVSEYNVSLTSGLVDPETAIPEFVEKLEASGIDKIIAEKQSQLDAWAAEKGK